MEIVKGLIRTLINGGIGLLIGLAFAEAFGWNAWVLGIAGYILGWLLLSKGFWEGVAEGKQELAEKERIENEQKKKGGRS